MKTALLLSLMTVSFMTTAQARGLFGSVNTYIIEKTGSVVSIGTNEINEDGTATFFSYNVDKKITVNMSDLSISTKSEIAGVKAGEHVLVKTDTVSNPNLTITRECLVFHVFENKQAYIGCKTYEADKVPGYQTPGRLNFVIKDLESKGVVAEVSSLDNFSAGDYAELRVETKSIKANKRIKVIAVFANGEALVESSVIGLNFLNTNSILNKFGTERVKLQDLNKL